MTDKRLYLNGGGKVRIRRARDATLPTNARCCECGGQVFARNRKAQKAINETRAPVPCHRCGG